MKYNNYDEMPMFLSIKDVADTIGLSVSENIRYCEHR